MLQLFVTEVVAQSEYRARYDKIADIATPVLNGHNKNSSCHRYSWAVMNRMETYTRKIPGNIRVEELKMIVLLGTTHIPGKTLSIK